MYAPRARGALGFSRENFWILGRNRHDGTFCSIPITTFVLHFCTTSTVLYEDKVHRNDQKSRFRFSFIVARIILVDQAPSKWTRRSKGSKCSTRKPLTELGSVRMELNGSWQDRTWNSRAERSTPGSVFLDDAEQSLERAVEDVETKSAPGPSS